ncbi:c-type cytochrome [Stenotrophomonas sp. Iso1]|uniref:c-type cytochrome n=1 Tax=Stenotrophomonas sp. Iso1 TaxID=2977283 RepID=UPI0022B7B35B|nr:c-type cytochrome [Stenotrophomonas sp. Iso1]
MRHLLILGASLLLAACGGQSPTPPPVAAAPTMDVAPAVASTTAAATISGEQAFAMCSACHSRQAGAPQRMGPSLQGLVGRKAGSSTGFAYSPALQASGIVWDAKTLDTYLTAPTRMVPGTRMVIAVPDPARRQALIEYLSTP